MTASAAYATISYNSIDQTTVADGTNMAYAGTGQADRITVGATTQTHTLLGDQVDAVAGVSTYYNRDPQGTLASEVTLAGEYYYAFDGNRSVIALVDTTGTQRAAYTYDPYGANATATALNGTLPTNPWRYDSGYLDPSGLCHFGARYYDPTTGRFTQLDPAASSADGNRYAYAGDDPVNFEDPSGRVSLSCQWWGGCDLYLTETDVSDIADFGTFAGNRGRRPGLQPAGDRSRWRRCGSSLG
ncbi:MAG TPA: RHS repeat-associated core domain-containing protein [Acidimicrobiales bacterium]|nr:RHS repeat-associated core domain-containing protein [Acidimicrobiales bacterium]